MAIKYSFVDGASYGPEDINGITSSLVGAGVAPFLTKDSYNVSDLNVLTEALVEEGVQLEGCKCAASDVGTQNMSVSVGQGIVFFASGARLEVDSDGYTVAVTPNTAGYIYAYFNSTLQTADILFAEELSTDGESVVLAQLTVDGVLKDKRVFARSKVGTMGTNVTLTTEFTVLDEPVLYSESDPSVWYILAKAENVNVSKFNYAQVCTDGTLEGSNGVSISGLGNWMAFVSLSENAIKYGGHDGNIWKADCLYYTSYTTRYIPKVINDELCLLVRCSKSNFKSAVRALRACRVTFM